MEKKKKKETRTRTCSPIHIGREETNQGFSFHCCVTVNGMQKKLVVKSQRKKKEKKYANYLMIHMNANRAIQDVQNEISRYT